MNSYYAAAAAQQMNALDQLQGFGQMSYGGGGSGGGCTSHTYTTSPPVKETKVKDEILPDISLTRVFKWAIVLVIGMALGKRVWSMFGEKITNNLHKALDHVSGG